MEPGTTYYYQVAAVYSNGSWSALSSEVSVQAPQPPPEPAPEPEPEPGPAPQPTPAPQPAPCTPAGTAFGTAKSGTLGTVDGLTSSAFDFTTGASVLFGSGDLRLSDEGPWQLSAYQILYLGPGSFSATLSFMDSGWQSSVPLAETHVYLVKTSAGKVVQVALGRLQTSPYGSPGITFQWAVAKDAGTTGTTCTDSSQGTAPVTTGCVSGQGRLHYSVVRAGTLGTVGGLYSRGFDFSQGAPVVFGRSDLTLSDDAPWLLQASQIRDRGAGSFKADLAYTDEGWQSSVLLTPATST